MIKFVHFVKINTVRQHIISRKAAKFAKENDEKNGYENLSVFATLREKFILDFS